MPGEATANLIKTFLRERCLTNTVRSIQTHCDVPFRLYIADDGPFSPGKECLSVELTAAGHHVVCFDQPTSVGAARNTLVESLTGEPFVLRIDDDFEFFEDTRLAPLQAILRFDPRLAAVADIEIQCGDGKGVLNGEISPIQGFFEMRGRTLYKTCIPVVEWEWRRAGAYRYAYADHTRNFLLIRRAFFDTCRWDHRLYCKREHSDFMLPIAKAGWKLAFSPDCIHRHRDDLARAESDDAYLAQKKGEQFSAASDQAFFRKWGIDKIATVKNTAYRNAKH